VGQVGSEPTHEPEPQSETRPATEPQPEPEPQTKTQPATEPRPEPELQLTPKPKMALLKHVIYNEWEDPELKEGLRILKKECKPGLMRDMADRFLKVVGSLQYISHNSPYGMYPVPTENAIPLSEFLRIFTKDWVESSIILSFAM
jgi:hypothetical protein